MKKFEQDVLEITEHYKSSKVFEPNWEEQINAGLFFMRLRLRMSLTRLEMILNKQCKYLDDNYRV